MHLINGIPHKKIFKFQTNFMEGFMVVFWDKKSQIFIYSATELHDIVTTDLCNMINTLTNMVVMCNKKFERKNPTLKR